MVTNVQNKRVMVQESFDIPVPQGIQRIIALEQIDPPAVVLRKPTETFVYSVRVLGVLEPIIVSTDVLPITPNSTFKIVAGVRRYLAAQELGLDTIPATVFLEADISFAQVSLVENSQRADNDLAMLWAVEGMLQEGQDPDMVRKLSGWSKVEWRKRLSVLGLSPALRGAIHSGGMALGVAYEVAKLSPARQDELAAIFEESGKVRHDDIRTVRQAAGKRAAQQLTLIPGLFDVPSAEAAAGSGLPSLDPRPWEYGVVDLVRQAADLFPEGSAETYPNLKQTLLDLSYQLVDAVKAAERGEREVAYPQVPTETELAVDPAHAEPEDGEAKIAFAMPLPETENDAPVEDLEAYGSRTATWDQGEEQAPEGGEPTTRI